MNKSSEKKQKKVDKSSFIYRFRQQILDAWKPIPTINSTLWIFLAFGIFFIAFGVILVIMSSKIVETEVKYSNIDSCSTMGQECKTIIKIDKKMEQPVFLYYELDNFYQNHRKYVKSKDLDQLKGAVKSWGDLSDCDPVQQMKDLYTSDVYYSYGGSQLSPDAAANPCGLIAKSLFNDTFSISTSSGTKIEIKENDIAWPGDKKRFVRPSNAETIQWTDVENEHFIVWMRVAAFPTFRKLWGRIEVDLEPGDYTLSIQNNFPVASFDGSKKVVLSTANVFGGKNTFLSIAYLVVGSLCFLVFFGFLIKKLTTKEFLRTQKINIDPNKQN